MDTFSNQTLLVIETPDGTTIASVLLNCLWLFIGSLYCIINSLWIAYASWHDVFRCTTGCYPTQNEVWGSYGPGSPKFSALVTFWFANFQWRARSCGLYLLKASMFVNVTSTERLALGLRLEVLVFCMVLDYLSVRYTRALLLTKYLMWMQLVAHMDPRARLALDILSIDCITNLLCLVPWILTHIRSKFVNSGHATEVETSQVHAREMLMAGGHQQRYQQRYQQNSTSLVDDLGV